MTKTNFLNTCSLFLALTTLAACSPQSTPPATAPPDDSPSEPAALRLPAGAADAIRAIDAETLRAHVARLADDELAGRAPGSAGDRAARIYIAERLKAAGLRPAGPDGNWEQTFDIVGLTPKVPKVWSFQAGETKLDLASWDDFIAWSGKQQAESRLADAELVFVGYGIQAPEYGWDDFAGADLRGKVLVMLNNDPDWDPELFEGERRLYYGRWDYKYESAARQGAAGAILIHTTPSAGYPFQVVQTSWTGEQFELPAGDEPRLEIAAWATSDAVSRLVEAAGLSLDDLMEKAKSPAFEPIPLGLRTSFTLATTVNTTAQTANVLGILPGRDPELFDEVVIYMAHHDHLGTGAPDASGDTIYNGARDNALGVAQVLNLAKAFQALPEPPRRSILFLLVAAEEQGLLGSKYFAAHPVVPPGRIAAALNYDGGNIWGPSRDLIFIGYGKSSLDQVVELAAAEQGRTVVGDQFPDRGFFYRSDQFSLAKIGVPALYLEGGTDLIEHGTEEGRALAEAWEAEHYHQPSDELNDTWRFEGVLEDTRVGFTCGLHIAESDALPAWKAGDEFEAARQAALAAVAASEAAASAAEAATENDGDGDDD